MKREEKMIKEKCIPCKCYIKNGPKRCINFSNVKFVDYAEECPCINCIVKVTCFKGDRYTCPIFQEFLNKIICECGGPLRMLTDKLRTVCKTDQQKYDHDYAVRNYILKRQKLTKEQIQNSPVNLGNI